RLVPLPAGATGDGRPAALFALLYGAPPQVAEGRVARDDGVVAVALGVGEAALVRESLDQRLDAPLRVVGRALGRAVEIDVELDLQLAHVVFEAHQHVVN